MILRPLSPAPTNPPQEPESASTIFVRAEDQAKPPCMVLFQAEHSRLAGQLAAALCKDVFGELLPDVIRATGEHDFGWDDSDNREMAAIPGHDPRPFPRLSTQETLPSWRKSVEHGQQVGGLVDFLISRHFTLLGRSDPERSQFIAEETHRRTAMERGLPHSAEDLDRWTAAVGFCDLLSLYLCSGAQQPAEFPLAHPADQTSSDAPKVTISWFEDYPRFSRPILETGAVVRANGLQYDGKGAAPTPVTLEWKFV